ncbi:MAG: methyltransferase domain-containing protein [bacterium]
MRPDFYEEYAHIELHHWWAIARRKIILTVLNHYVPRISSQRVLDLGIGSGVMLTHLDSFGQIIGCDPERAALNFVNTRFREDSNSTREEGTENFPLVQGQAQHLPFQNESLDLITSLDVLEHIVDDETVLREIERVLRPGGTACVAVPMYPWLWGNEDLISHHVRRYRGGELEKKIETAGLQIIYRTYFNTLLFPIIAIVRLFQRWLHPSPDADRVPSDFSLTKPGLLNDALAWLFSQEARWIRHFNLPFGVSLLCVARKPWTNSELRVTNGELRKR